MSKKLPVEAESGTMRMIEILQKRLVRTKRCDMDQPRSVL